MTQIRLLQEANVPSTHALIIGVGYYKHLRGGPHEGVHLGLNVLESPPASALQLARWMIGSNDAETGLNNPSAPLATIEVLVSSRQNEFLQAAGATHAIESASLPAVQQGFDRWLKEVQRHPGNVGVIYFCGHGIMGDGPEHILLLDDHGSSSNRPFQTGSFDLSNTVRALWRKVEAQLYIFVDACRTFDRGVGESMAARPQPLLAGGASSANINRGTTLIESTGEGLPAYGDVNGVSRFTEALLQALNGYCGVQRPGTHTWLVNGSALSQAVPKLLSVVNRDRGGESQACAPHPSGAIDAPLHVIAQAPKVIVEIELTPEAQRPLSSYEIHSLIDATLPPIKGGSVAGVWRTEADKGMYEVRIASKTPCVISGQFFDPPHYHLPVEV
ncbi:caspase family protein [Stenotrophomonas maltophilia]|uniref:caspase family protein n=1 Tax=Stenotrophomonas maltophilia TaxID=40324 RepID=UPI0021C9AAEB|nr:caspase family protein [Stenotrophomonas maltophilia]MCU1156871.1 caspase family protein [Stenotrophomonas maltophilia]